MRIIIGIIIGIFIIFNWSSIRDYFDQKLSKSEEAVAVEGQGSQNQPSKAPQQKNTEKVDSFKDFK
jgi:hypothetical protein